MSAPLLEVSNLTVRLPGEGDRRFGVQEVSFTVNAGETTCLVGESGSGKSLTAQSILGLLPQSFDKPTGRIAFEGVDLLELHLAQLQAIRGRRIGMIFQEPMTALNPLQRVNQQIEEVLTIHGDLDRRGRKDRVQAILAEVNLNAADILDRYPHQLSGGQRQRVMIAMALVMDPKLLIADEPTTALDVTTQAQVLKLIKSLQTRHGTGVLFITHDFGVVSEIAHSVSVMRHARVVESGPAAQILTHPEQAYTRQLLDAVPKGRLAASRPPSLAEPVLQVQGMHKVFGKVNLFGIVGSRFKAVDHISFELSKGEILGVVGESGSGKSTLARCVARLIRPDEGQVTLEGQNISSLEGEKLRVARRDIQFVFQDPYSSLNPRRRVARIIAQGPINYGENPTKALARAQDLLELVGLDRAAGQRFPGEFSGGQRQRICIARALALEPKVLIADEAVSALDVSIQAQILKLLLDIRQRLQLAIIFITHDLRVAAEVCDRIMVMRNGQVIEQGPAAKILLEPEQAYTRILIDAMPGQKLTAMADRLNVPHAIGAGNATGA